MHWGMPPPPRTGGPPVTNIHNTSPPHWRMWLKPENRLIVRAQRPSSKKMEKEILNKPDCQFVQRSPLVVLRTP
jgi:hypothetical protein